MLIFSKARLVFLSVPKTGTTAYHTALAEHADLVISDPPALKHAPVYRYNRFIRPMYEKVCNMDLELMAVMREPVSWLSSWYRYRSRPSLEGHPNSTAGMSFDDFVLAHIQSKPPGFADVGRQSRFLEGRPNGVHVQHLFAYENQTAVQEFLSERLGVGFELSRENVSPKGTATLSTEVAAQAREALVEDFDLYESLLG